MNKIIIIGVVVALLIALPIASAWSFDKFKPTKKLRFNPIGLLNLEKRHVISVSDPSEYNADDLIRFAEMGIDLHNWCTWFGGKMTAYRYPNGTYYLSEEQRELITYYLSEEQRELIIDLYDEGQRIFWIGVTSDHINWIWENPYDETANMVKAYVSFFMEEHLWFAKVGLYVPVWHDEIITRLRPGMTWQEQFDLVETTRAEIESRLNYLEWEKVRWTVTGQDLMTHGMQTFQLTNDEVSYWAHHTDVTEPEEAEDLVYHHNFTVMADSEWKETWEAFKKFAWTDGPLVEGDVGERQLTELGEVIFDV